MHVMLLCRRLEFGGAERQVVELACGLRRRGHRVTVATFYAGGGLEAALAGSGVATVNLGKRGRWDSLGFLWRAVRILRRYRPDIVYGFLPIANLAALVTRIALPGAKVVWGLRGSAIDHHRYDRLPALAYWLERRCARCPDLVIANSRAGADHALAAGFPAATMQVVPNGVDTGRFRADGAARARLRAEWNVAPEAPLIGLVGRLDPMKDVPLFLAAAARIAAANAAARFAVVGDGPEPYRAALAEEADRLGLAGRLLWRPGRADIETVYNGLDILVSASAFGEGFSNVLAEAMACGTPVVATDVGDAAALVGPWGVIVPPRDAQAMADAVGRLLGALPEQRQAIAQGARRHIEEGFSVAALAERTERLLQPLLPHS